MTRSLMCQSVFRTQGTWHRDHEAALRSQADQRRNERDRATAIATGSHYAHRYVLEERISAVKDGKFKAWISERFPILYLDLTAMVSRVETRSTTLQLKRTKPKYASSLNRLATRAVDFVIETYRERRPHWTPEFLAKLRNIAIEWLPESTYITIEKSIGLNEREILGTLRVIGERNGKLPMELYLGIEIDTNGRPKQEPGNFAINKNVSDDVWPEIMIQLWSNLNRSSDPAKPNHYITYADEFSLKLYSLLGFKPIPTSKIQALPETQILPSGKILKDNIEWTPMEASQETMDQLLELHVTRLKRRGRPTAEIESLLQRRPETNATNKKLRKHFWGEGHIDGTERKAFLEVRHSVFDQYVFDIKSEDLKIHQNIGMIDATQVPLQEGALIRTGTGRDEGIQITYTNGILRIEDSDPYSPQLTEIEISADLAQVGRVRFRSRTSDITLRF